MWRDHPEGPCHVMVGQFDGELFGEGQCDSEYYRDGCTLVHHCVHFKRREINFLVFVFERGLEVNRFILRISPKTFCDVYK